MFCAKCGKEIYDSVQFCNYCGAPTSSDTTVNRDISRQVNLGVNNKMVSSERVLCPECHGRGETRSVLRIIVSIVIILGILFVQFIMQSLLFIDALDRGSGGKFFGLMVFNGLIDIGILYWGMRKSTCSACQGRGRLYL